MARAEFLATDAASGRDLWSVAFPIQVVGGSADAGLFPLERVLPDRFGRSVRAIERSRRFIVASEDSTTSGVAGRYASALFELAKDQKKVAEVESNLNTVQKLLDQSPDFVRMIRNPVFSADDQSKAMSAVNAKIGVSGLAANFLQVLARNRRLFALPDMVRAFREIAARDRGEVAADVVSAHALTDAQMKSLADALKASVGKDVKIQAKVDPSLLGGLVVKVGSRMLDSSLKTKLNALKVAMKGTG